MPTARALYPGQLAGPTDLLRLADEYRQAAYALAGLGRKGDPISRAPYRLAAIHAVELYLNALLLYVGHEPSRIRGLQHDLATRTELCIGSGLSLRKRTLAHLRAMAVAREYLISRYGPELASTLSQVNRLAATLDEVATKVRLIVTSAVGDAKSSTDCCDHLDPRARRVPATCG